MQNVIQVIHFGVGWGRLGVWNPVLELVPKVLEQQELWNSVLELVPKVLEQQELWNLVLELVPKVLELEWIGRNSGGLDRCAARRHLAARARRGGGD